MRAARPLEVAARLSAAVRTQLCTLVLWLRCGAAAPQEKQLYFQLFLAAPQRMSSCGRQNLAVRAACCCSGLGEDLFPLNARYPVGRQVPQERGFLSVLMLFVA